MTRKIANILAIIAVVITLALGGIATKYFLIGRVLVTENSMILDVVVDESEIEITGHIMASAEAFRSYSYRVDENCVYIRINSVFVSDFYQSGKIDFVISGEFKDIKAIYLEDNEKTRVIWELENQN